jgi:hypothetical protein
MEAIRSSETSVHRKTTRRHIPENGILHESPFCLNSKTASFLKNGTELRVCVSALFSSTFFRNNFCFRKYLTSYAQDAPRHTFRSSYKVSLNFILFLLKSKLQFNLQNHFSASRVVTCRRGRQPWRICCEPTTQADPAWVNTLLAFLCHNHRSLCLSSVPWALLPPLSEPLLNCVTLCKHLYISQLFINMRHFWWRSKNARGKGSNNTDPHEIIIHWKPLSANPKCQLQPLRRFTICTKGDGWRYL